MHKRTTLQSVYIKAVTKDFDGKRICIGFCSLEELLFRAGGSNRKVTVTAEA